MMGDMMMAEMAWRRYATECGWDGDDMSTEEIAEMAISEIATAREYGIGMADITEDMIAWAEAHR